MKDSNVVPPILFSPVPGPAVPVFLRDAELTLQL